MSTINSQLTLCFLWFLWFLWLLWFSWLSGLSWLSSSVSFALERITLRSCISAMGGGGIRKMSLLSLLSVHKLVTWQCVSLEDQFYAVCQIKNPQWLSEIQRSPTATRSSNCCSASQLSPYLHRGTTKHRQNHWACWKKESIQTQPIANNLQEKSSNNKNLVWMGTYTSFYLHLG